MKYAIMEDRVVIAVFKYESQRDACCTELMVMYPKRWFRSVTVKEVMLS